MEDRFVMTIPLLSGNKLGACIEIMEKGRSLDKAIFTKKKLSALSPQVKTEIFLRIMLDIL